MRRGLKRAVLRVLPLPTWMQLRFELHMLGVRVRSLGAARHYRHRRDLLVNLGAGTEGKAGWVNVDAFRFAGINCLLDVRRGLPFADGAVRGFFCEHFLEHIDYEAEAPKLLRECHRALRPGGVLRLVVPDAEKYLRAYCAEGWGELERIRPLRPQQTDAYYGHRYATKMELVNFIFRQVCDHKFAYDAETLIALLRRCGFARVAQQAFGQSLMPEICLDQPMRASESLYVEAVKE